MYAILAYDIRIKRVAKVRKTVKKYLRPVQRSVFEGYITESGLEKLKSELLSRIDCSEDAVRIYRLESLRWASLDEIGVVTCSSAII